MANPLTVKHQRSSPLFLEAFRQAAGRVPIWLVIGTLTSLLAYAAAHPWLSWFAGETAHNYEPKSLALELDRTFRQDHAAGLATLNSATASAGAMLALLAMAMGVFFAGGWLQIFLEKTHGHSLRRFFYGGSRYFWRFFRLLILTLCVLACGGWVIYDWPFETLVLEMLLGIPEADFGSLETLHSELDVVHLRWIQDGLYALFFALVSAWGTYGRTRVALHEGRSVIWAGMCSFFTIVLHPLRTLRPLAGLFAIDALVRLWLAPQLLEKAAGSLEQDPGYGAIASLALVNLLALFIASALRGAGYFAAVRVSQDVVRPLSRPDPWKGSIGPPGGPQYLPGKGDEYGVSL
ncbi:MAG: hypothetical protein QF724_06450 [Planctomycetota bacterium]|jgi:hypothetical protein|nr:hypothetical protein [Planctomycetota bacterium]MDP6838561.1 hypothetical protein [Planctomycetota bacterium]MDP6954955.1 hypothetical protein [Planctomycetota bacterium]